MRGNKDCGSFRVRGCRLIQISAILVMFSGCFDWSSMKPAAEGQPTPESAGGVVSNSDAVESVDPDGAAIGELAVAADVESDDADRRTPAQQQYIDVASPFIKAVAERDYAAAFTRLGPLARSRLSRNQFVPVDDDQELARYESEAIDNPTADQFVAMMKLAEAFYGLPARMDPPQVETDPEILSRQDPVLAAFEIGNMPDSIPVAHRKAAVQSQVYCRLTAAQLKAGAEAEGVDEAEYRSMLDEALAEGEGPYFKLKTVVIDDGAGPVIGYFELAPRSIFD